MISAPYDFHVHTRHSFDSTAGMEDVCRAAIAAGMTDIAVTDHVEMAAYYRDGFDKTIAESFYDAGNMQALFRGKLRVARGVELGEPLQDREATDSLLGKYDFDFVLCSLHNLTGDQDFYFYDFSRLTDDDIHERLTRYFDELLETVRWGGFDSLAHLDYPFRYIPEARRPGYTRWQPRIDDILTELSRRDKALEINTSGLRQGVGRTLPGVEIARRFRELGGRFVTLGSDAHKPADIGAGIEQAAAVAREAGFGQAAVFHGNGPELRGL